MRKSGWAVCLAFWKISIEGPSVQGVSLREEIAKIAKRLGITGFVANVGEEVEVILQAEGVNANKFLEEIKRVREDPKMFGTVSFSDPSLVQY
jgi:acylphosphatase